MFHKVGGPMTLKMLVDAQLLQAHSMASMDRMVKDKYSCSPKSRRATAVVLGCSCLGSMASSLQLCRIIATIIPSKPRTTGPAI